jgi:hypothetical protein
MLHDRWMFGRSGIEGMKYVRPARLCLAVLLLRHVAFCLPSQRTSKS